MKNKPKYISQFHIILIMVLLVSLNGCNTSNGNKEGEIGHLKTEGFDHWIVTDEAMPKLSWQPISHISEQKVIGYELLVADNKNDLEQNNGNLLELTVTKIENGPWFYFDASKLPARTVALWRVRAVLEDDSRGAWSETFHFEIGLKNKSDWSGKWIGMHPELRQKSAPWFRNSFEINKTITKARLYVCGLGMHESWLNGKKIGNELLQPAQTDYNIRSFYVAHDVSKLLNQGQNTLGFWLGDGFYNQDRVWGANGLSYGQPKVLAQLEITFDDGSTSIIATDENWLCKSSAITASNVYAGENYNSNLYDPLWSKNQNNTSSWKPVNLETVPGKTLVAQQLPPCRITDTVFVKEINQLHPNTWFFDFGQNLVGWAKMKIDATPNTKITIRFAEDKLSTGELNFATSGVRATKVIQTDTYICKGNGEEIWEPRFSYHGFRFAEVTISNGELKNKIPTKDLLQGMVVHTDMTVTGEFSSSDDTLNQIFDMAHWTQSGGVLGIPMDCPVRERCGWTGDAHLTVPYTMYRFDAASMWRKYTTDIATTAEVSAPMLCFGDEFGERTKQIKKYGIPTMVAPGKRFIGEGSPDWGSAIAFIPWDIYAHTGDIRSLKEHYNSIKQWTEHLQGISTNSIVYSGMGDWCKPIVSNPEGKTEREIYGKITPMLSTACYYRSARITADAAQLIGNKEDYLYFDKLASDIRTAFTKAFYGKDRILIPDQTINAIAVDWNVLSHEHQAQAAEALNQQVIAANYHFETGVFGMPSLWPVLGRFGYHETLWKVLQNENAPSFKHLMSKGASTFWEVWPTENENLDNYKQSMSHPFQAAFVSWFYEGLAGIKPNSKLTGYRLIHLEPQIIPELEWVKCRFSSPMGMIESSWNQNKSTLTWQVEIPAGAEARLRVPGTLINVEKDSKAFKVETNKISDAQGIAEKLTLHAGKYIITSNLK
ncbi:family 78 glycoside hydrolase catalytic domain [Algibacter miyuki]|uniref:alpha-L-rhamnosidase n=1 Tax=Algibacter miyuki TaxID=1306933 RepID=A0ABV5H4L2_9FLAO|nr:alpha-L-rhamnosidase [Algibacter miyuki]MDN3663981.1 family 78 glycoside hydrolase catalytic domain [Algibacter miyuki]